MNKSNSNFQNLIYFFSKIFQSKMFGGKIFSAGIEQNFSQPHIAGKLNPRT